MPSATNLASTAGAGLPSNAGDRRVTPDRRAADRRRSGLSSLQMMFAPGEPVSALAHTVFFGALDAAGVNGETARVVCAEDPDRPINSGAWSRMRRNDPNDPKRQPLRWAHVQRAYVGLGPKFAAEFDRLWREALVPTDLGQAVAALASIARMAETIIGRLAPAEEVA